mmetsp:Transcript_90505/g.146455  ORF Transcript_90505/g.146455 Transcript_90505/m.146455 type:complete len:228 (+) Transcript_90505:13-696(+)
MDFLQKQRTTALLFALLALGSLLVLSPRPKDTTVLFGACCDESICSKYAIQKCAHTTGGKQDKEEREINTFLKQQPSPRPSSAEKSSVGSRGRAAHFKRRGPEQHWFGASHGAEINHPGALKMAERLGLTSDHRRADAKVMSRSLRSLMKKAGREPPSLMSSDSDLPPPTVGLIGSDAAAPTIGVRSPKTMNMAQHWFGGTASTNFPAAMKEAEALGMPLVKEQSSN